jgi:hypothetical protein
MRLNLLLVQRSNISSTTRGLDSTAFEVGSPLIHVFSGFHPELRTLMPSAHRAKHHFNFHYDESLGKGQPSCRVRL